jgi:hypothetical protein
VQAKLICKAASAGYSIGDELIINNQLGALTSQAGHGISIDSTNITVIYCNEGSVYNALNKTTGDNIALVDASWRLVVSAWA